MAIKVIALRKSARRPRRKRLAPLAYTAPLAVNARVRVAGLVASVGVLPMTVHAMTAGRGKPGPGGVVAIVGQGASAFRAAAGAMFKAVLAGAPRIAIAAKLISTAGQVAQMSATALAALRAKVLPSGVLGITGRAGVSFHWLGVPFVYTAFVGIVGSLFVGVRLRAGPGAMVATSAVARLKGSALVAPRGRVPLAGSATASGAAKAGAQVTAALAGAVQIVQRVADGLLTSVGLVVRFLGAVQVSALLGRAPLALRAFATQMFSGRAGAKGAAAMAGRNMLTLTVGVAPKGRVAIAGQATAASSARPGSVAIAMLASRAIAAVRAKVGSSTALALTVRLLAAVVGNVVPSGKLPLASNAEAAWRGRGAPSGVVSILGRGAIALFGKASPSLVSSLVGRAFAAVTAALQNAALPLALRVKSQITVRARDFLGGAVGIAGRSTAALPSKAAPGLAAALATIVGIGVKAGGAVKLPLALAGKIAASVSASLTHGTLTIFLSSVARTALRATGAYAARAPLGGLVNIVVAAFQPASKFIRGGRGRYLKNRKFRIRKLINVNRGKRDDA